MAEKLDVPWSTYTRYETNSRYKKPHLPLALARRIARVLSDHGIDQDEVLALAGVGADEAMPSELTAGEDLLLDKFRALTPAQRNLVHQILDDMTGRAQPTGDATVHAPPHPYRAREADTPEARR